MTATITPATSATTPATSATIIPATATATSALQFLAPSPRSISTAHEAVAPSPRVWRVGLVAGIAAAAATTAIAAVAQAADVPLEMGGEAIPLAGFAQLTLLGAALGVLLAWVVRRRSARPRQRFVVATVALTALSCVPDVLADASAASKAVLIVTHLVAAAIVIPSIAARLPHSTVPDTSTR
jgi:hypothetical protein